ncbi:MAG: cyclic nucleotide-binding domain-containing protein [Ignavibacteria bacterium]|nr:cyclic nucleotide-binding domain-containing protein [Ignavibacteria bacterium]
MPLHTSIREIKHNRLFTGVKESVLASFFDQKDFKEAKEGEILYRKGDVSNSIYLIIKGEVKVKFPSHSYVATKIQNDFFGEKELVEETKRNSSAMAFSKLHYYRIDKTLLDKVIKKNSMIEENLKNFGEFKLPESSFDGDRKFNIAERDRPVSFRMFSSRSKKKEEGKDEKAPPPVLTQQHLPDLESIEMSIEDEEINAPEENLELEEALEELQEINTQIPEEDIEVPNEEKEPTLDPIQENIESPDESKPIETQLANLKLVEKASPETLETGINREIVRRIFWALSRIYSGISITELVQNTKQALKDLTNSESADLIFIDEKLLKMYKLVSQDGKTKNEYFQLSDGLTGICAIQKNPINYDRPTEDSNFNPKIDQPGPSRLKRILYFPIINDSGETIAVLQTARDNIKFTEDEIWYLTMISKQMETAISRTKTLEEMVNKEKLNSGKKLSEILTKEIHIPIEIIDSYTKILSSKNLPQDTDDLIRMIQKQAASVIDITDSILKVLVDEIILTDNKIHFNEFIDDVLELLSEYCETMEVKLFKKIGDGAVVNIDRSKLYTAILQFIKASVADSRKGDGIYFSTELIGDSISVSIQNEGKGFIAFPEGEILDYFYYKEKIKDDEVHLLLAKKIIIAHSGQVEIESIKGVGSTFKITLPVAR